MAAIVEKLSVNLEEPLGKLLSATGNPIRLLGVTAEGGGGIKNEISCI